MLERTKTVITVLMTMVMLMSAVQILSGDDGEVSASESDKTDSYGYTWIDERDPDPKVSYNWIDASSGTKHKSTFQNYYSYYDAYYGMSTPLVNMPFPFPFYGKYYSQMYLWPSGVISFAQSTYGWVYDNWDGPLPNQGYYTPPAIIAVWWCYGGFDGDDSSSEVYTMEGVTTKGVRYLVVSFENIINPMYGHTYGYGDCFVTAQAILYETGDIHINVKDAHSDDYYSEYYVTVGIMNEVRDAGLTYMYDDASMIRDNAAILFKQYKTEVYNTEFTEGFGPEKNVYPAFGGMGVTDYMMRTEVYCEKGLGALEYLDYTIIPSPQADTITLRYDFQRETFKKLGDPLKTVYFNETHSFGSSNLSDPANRMVLEFHYDFNFNWVERNLVSVRFTLTGVGVKATVITKDNVFRVVPSVMMEGNLSAEDSRGRQLQEGDWVRGRDRIRFYGLTSVYSDPAVPDYISPPDIIQIGVKDQSGNLFVSETSGLLDVHIYVEPVYSEMEYRLTYINVTSGNDMSPESITIFYENGFNLLVDSDNPGLPQALQIWPDGDSLEPSNFDNDRQIRLKWDDALDSSSGIGQYLISVNKPKKEARTPIAVPKVSSNEEYAQLIDNLPEGTSRIYMWAEDVVGNSGNEIFVDIMVDLSGVTFSGFYPATGIWLNTIRPTCQIYINDTATGVDPDTIYYEVATSRVGLAGNWLMVQDAYLPGTTLRVVVKPKFNNGKDNWIRFRATDEAGNDLTESEPYNVWVDAEAPRSKLTSPDDKTYNVNPYQEVKIRVEDPHSGIDAQSLEYRLTTRGLTKWTPWKTYREGENGAVITIVLYQNFRRGADNYVQVRGRDVIGNAFTSPVYNIKINTVPTLVITSPNEGDDYYDDQEIVFDASDSFDTDGDGLPSITWIGNNGRTTTILGENIAYIESNLQVGMWTIQVTAKDKVGNEAMITLTLSIITRPEDGSDDESDSDLDGMPDWFEENYKTKVLEKDETEDPDGDGYINLYEYQNLTNPNDPRSHPVDPYEVEAGEDKGPFSSLMWPLWGLLLVLIIAILIVMVVARTRQDKAIKRIKSIRNMRRIMPSVSWDQITTTAYIAPMTQGAMLPGAAAMAQGPTLPAATPEVPADRTLPPAPASVAQAAEAQVAAPPVGTFQAAPAPAAVPYTPPPVQ